MPRAAPTMLDPAMSRAGSRSGRAAIAAELEDPPVDEAPPTVKPVRYARINQGMILFTSKGKPLPLNAKGLVRRKDALGLYTQEIDTL